MPLMRVYVKKRIQIDKFGSFQRQMFDIGLAGLASVKDRVRSALDANDRKAPPLNKHYAITKSRIKGGRALRDMTFTGETLNNLSLRTVSSRVANAALTTRHARNAGNAADRFFRRRTGSSWLAWSPKNQDDTVKAAFKAVTEAWQRLLR